MERSIHCPSPVINGRVTTIVESKKRPPQIEIAGVFKIDENEEIDLRTDEAETGDDKALRCLNNTRLISAVYASSTKSSLNTPVAKPDKRVQNHKKALNVQNNLLNMLRSNPNENKPGPTITSEFQGKKEKEVKKNVLSVKSNLKNLL